ncbi:protein S100-A1-like isoform X1 [Oncorhynchus keta]|uniref:protein S100-A1-like isoform X1 n=2 Tax=Oncorhynchus TaxID=8016 RepID=UPI00227BBBEC|nr:protein S100-A1-like isoform X1 [Oncorhynchus keta]
MTTQGVFNSAGRNGLWQTALTAPCRYGCGSEPVTPVAMESAIQTVVGVYLKSAKGKGSLGDKDFQGLVNKQLGNVMTGTDSSSAVKEMRKGLDENKDGKVSFQEYMTLIGYVANTLSEQRTAANNTPAS